MPFDDSEHRDGWDGPRRNQHRDMAEFVDGILASIVLSCELSDKCIACTMRRVAVIALGKWLAIGTSHEMQERGITDPDDLHDVTAEDIRKVMAAITNEYATQLVELLKLEAEAKRNG